MKFFYIPFVILLVLLLAACSPATPATLFQPVARSEVTTPAGPTAQVTEPAPTQSGQPASSLDMQLPERIDSQGEVEVVVSPLNLDTSEQTLKFDVSLNTHSVDLSMDLATLATLTTDDGRTIQATQWDAQRGGHHVSGTLSFPASVDGKPVLEGVSKLTLIIQNLDALERVFTWNLKP